MVMKERRRDNSEVITGPITNGLREAVEVSKIRKLVLARDVGISKPQFYRFLKGDRSLSQENLDKLAQRLGVRVVLQCGPPDRTESRDSATPTATGPEVGSAPARPDSTDPTSRVLADLEAAIDEQFADFESRLVGRMLVSGWEEPGVWERLRRWFEPPSRDDGGGSSTSPGDPSVAGGSPADRILRRAPILDAAPTTPNGLLDSLRISVKVRVHEALGDLATEMRAGGDVGRGTISPPTAPEPPGDPKAATIPRHSAAPPIHGGGCAGEDCKGVLGVTERIGPVDDGEEVGESEERVAPLVGRRRLAPQIRPSPVTPTETIFDDDDQDDGDHDDGDYDGEDEYDFEDEEDGDSAPSSPTFDAYAEPEPKPEPEAESEPEPNSLKAQLVAMRQKMASHRSLLDDDDEYVPPPPPPPDPVMSNVEDDYIGTGKPSASASRERPADIERTGWREKIPYAIKGVQNPGIVALAEKLAKPKGGGSKDMAKFVYFMTQLIGSNPDAKEILAMPDLADRYKEIAKKVEHPEHVGKVANYLNPEDLFPAGDDPAGFLANLRRILERQGIHEFEVRQARKPRGR